MNLSRSILEYEGMSELWVRKFRYRDPSQQDGEAILIDNEADRLTTVAEDEEENMTETPMYEGMFRNDDTIRFFTYLCQIRR